MAGFASVLYGAQAGAQNAQNKVGQAVANTVEKAVRNDYPNATEAEKQGLVDSTIAAIKSANQSLYDSTCGAGKTWLCYAIYLQVAQGTPVTAPYSGGTGTGGGGATGAWTPGTGSLLCDNFPFRIDAGNALIVPAIKLQGGGPMSPGQNFTPTWTTSVHINATQQTSQNADGPGPIALWAAHNFNKTRGTDKRNWVGYYKATWTGGTSQQDYTFVGASQSYYNSAGSLVGRTTFTRTSMYDNNRMQNTTGCPEMETSGGDFDFYWNRTGPQCTWYVPNFDLGSTGYSYPEEAAVPYPGWLNWPDQDTPGVYTVCPISRELIRALSNGLWQKACNTPGYAGAPCDPVQPDEVMDSGPGGETVNDLKNPGVPDPNGQGNPVPPDPSATPTPTPSSSSSPDYDPNVSLPDLNAGEIDWWPDLPTVDLDLGSPTCPTYSFQALNQTFSLTSHCPLIEQNRATISLIMIAVFTVSAVFIVLRA